MKIHIMKDLRSILFVCLLAVCSPGGRAEVETGQIKIRYWDFTGILQYLDEVSPGILGASPDSEGLMILVESLGDGRYLLSTDPGVASDVARARFLFNNSFAEGMEGTPPNCYSKDGTGLATFVDAIRRKGALSDALYIPDDVPVTDMSQLDALAEAGKIRKIDLTKENNFVFAFAPPPDASDLLPGYRYPKDAVFIESETGGWAAVNERDLTIRFADETYLRFSVFIVGEGQAPPSMPGDTVIFTPSAPSYGEGRRREGTIDVSSSVSFSALFSLTFTLTLPDGLNLNPDATRLIDELASLQELSMEETDGSWKIEIVKPGAAGFHTAFPAADAGKIASIAYTVDESVGAGMYEALLKDLSCAGEGVSFHQKAVSVQITVDAPSGNEPVAEQEQVYASSGALTVQTPVAEDIALYDAAGALLFRAWKPVGRATFDIRTLPHGVVIVHGSSGWTKKIMN
jgi:hypothetical protein